MLYHFGKPRASLEYAKSSMFDFRPSSRVLDVSNYRLSLCLHEERQRSTRPPSGYSDVIVTVLCNSARWRQHWNRLRRFCCVRHCETFTTNYMQDVTIVWLCSFTTDVHPLFKRVMSVHSAWLATDGVSVYGD